MDTMYIIKSGDMRYTKGVVAMVDAQSPANRCNRLNCSLYVIETEPPLDPPLTACSNPDCDRAIKAHA
jgi:hypothetical protein